MRRIAPLFPPSHEAPRIGYSRLTSGIVSGIRNGQRRTDAPKDCGSHETIYNRFSRWDIRLTNNATEHTLRDVT